jgi:hypothetical protein
MLRQSRAKRARRLYRSQYLLVAANSPVPCCASSNRLGYLGCAVVSLLLGARSPAWVSLGLPLRLEASSWCICRPGRLCKHMT